LGYGNKMFSASGSSAHVVLWWLVREEKPRKIRFWKSKLRGGLLEFKNTIKVGRGKPKKSRGKREKEPSTTKTPADLKRKENHKIKPAEGKSLRKGERRTRDWKGVPKHSRSVATIQRERTAARAKDTERSSCFYLRCVGGMKAKDRVVQNRRTRPERIGGSKRIRGITHTGF